MPHRTVVAILAFLLLHLAANVASASGFVASYDPLAGNVAQEDALLHHTNVERAGAGLPELVRDDALTLAARHHAAEMARLRYVSHESPVARNATLPDRVARAGSAAQVVGENIARVPNGSDAASVTVDGWMASPGHRENLLNPRFTHVGFGTATNGSGDLYVVQVLAHDPLQVQDAQVQERTIETPQVAVSLEMRAPRDVALGYGEEYLPIRSLQPGRHTLAFPYAQATPVHVRAGVRAPASSGGFVGQDGGWFDPAGPSWRASESFPRQDLRITDVAPRVARASVQRIELALARAPSTPLGVWLDGVPFDAFTLEGRRLVIDVPSDRSAPVVGVGLQDPSDARRYSIVLGFVLRNEGGVPRLRPHALN